MTAVDLPSPGGALRTPTCEWDTEVSSFAVSEVNMVIPLSPFVGHCDLHHSGKNVEVFYSMANFATGPEAMLMVTPIASGH